MNEYLKSVKIEYQQLVNKGDAKINQLKEEVHKLKVKAHYKWNQIDIEKKKVQQLKKNLDVNRNKCQELEAFVRKSEYEIRILKEKAMDMEVKVTEIEKNHQTCIKELEDWYEDDRHCTMKDMEKVLQSKEKEWEVKVKEVNELKSDIERLERFLKLKQFYIDSLQPILREHKEYCKRIIGIRTH